MKYKHETNFIGMMLAVFASLLVIGSIMQLFPKNTMRIIDTTSLYENEITGAVSGMEGVSGFATKYTWTNPKTGAREEDTKPPQSVVYQAEITGVSGQKDKLEYYAVDASKPYKTLVRDSSASQWYAAKTPPSGAIRSPTFDIKNPEKFNIDMDAYVQDTTKRATAKKEEDIAKPLITAAENWKKNPNDIKAKERFDLERKKWDIYRETKTNPSALVSYLGSLDKIEQTVARELIIQRRNDPVVRNALAAEAQSESASESVAELNSLIELEQKVSQFCAKCKIDFNTGQTIDKNDKRGWGLNQDGTIDTNIKGQPITSETAKKIDQTVDKAFEQYNQQAGAEPFTKKDGKRFDTYGREVSLSFNSQTKLWDITSRKAQSSIKSNDGRQTLSWVSDLSATAEGKQLPVYKDSHGKLYNYKGELLSENTEVIKPTNIGEVEAQLVFKVEDGRINTDKPERATINNQNVPAIAYNDIISLVKSAGKDPKVTGSLDTALLISDGKKDIGRVTSVVGFEGVPSGVKIESEFVDLPTGTTPLKTKTASTDGKISIEETREIKEIDTGKLDSKGKPILEKTVITKNWIKLEQTGEAVKDKDGGELYKLVLRTERTYNIDEKTRKQTGDYTDITTDSVTGEPLKLSLCVQGKISNAEFKDGEARGDTAAIAQLNTLRTQYDFRQIFFKLESALTSFRGLGFYASFFLSDKELDDLRESVDKIFAENYLGVEYWESALCAANIDRDSKGIAYVDTRIGLAAVAAHIEASRSEEIKKPDVKREFLYKITFNVKNGDWKEDPKALERMRFNIELRGEKTNKVLKSDKSLGRGETFGKIGSSAIVQFSNFQYNEICILFDEVPYSWSLKDKKLCNKISGPPSQPTKIDIEKAGQQEETAAEGEGEINDI